MTKAGVLRTYLVATFMMAVTSLTVPGLIGTSQAQGGNAWVETSSMGSHRSAHRMVSLGDHRILSIGGYDALFGDPKVNFPPKYAIRSAEVFDPLLGTWAPAADMSVARSYFFAARLADGRILVAGGRQTTTSELYDPSTNTWSFTGSLPLPWSAYGSNTNATTVLSDGRVMIAGGYNDNLPLSSISTAAASHAGYLVGDGVTPGLTATLVDCREGLVEQFPPAAAGNIALVRQGGG